jgi:hypothetical protein
MFLAFLLLMITLYMIYYFTCYNKINFYKPNYWSLVTSLKKITATRALFVGDSLPIEIDGDGLTEIDVSQRYLFERKRLILLKPKSTIACFLLADHPKLNLEFFTVQVVKLELVLVHKISLIHRTSDFQYDVLYDGL